MQSPEGNDMRECRNTPSEQTGPTVNQMVHNIQKEQSIYEIVSASWWCRVGIAAWFIWKAEWKLVVWQPLQTFWKT